MTKPTINRRQFLPLLLTPLALIKNPLRAKEGVGWNTDLTGDISVMIRRLNKNKYHPIRCIDKRKLVFELANANPEIVSVDYTYPSAQGGETITTKHRNLRYPFDIDWKYGNTRATLTALDKTIYPPENKIHYCAHFKALHHKKEERIKVGLEFPGDDIQANSWNSIEINYSE